ncbi:MAG: glycosyltransferase family 2 protein [Candidatus Nanohaloarchaea archaeon]
MVSISATLITLNEEENIRECLESIKWCDEIIVVDSYSDDRTVEIAREYTDKIYQKEPKGYSEPYREFSIKKAEGDWILRVDPDEIVPKGLAERIQEEVQDESLDVLRVPRKNYAFGKPIKYGFSWRRYPDYQNLVFRPEAVEFSDEIHRYMDIREEAQVRKLPKNSDLDLHHFQYEGVSDYIGRMNRYTDIEADYKNFDYTSIFYRPLAGFLSEFLLFGGFLNGWQGFLISVLRAQYELNAQLKILEDREFGGDYSELYDEKKEELLDAYEKE